MKMIYSAPEMELVELETTGFLASSLGDIDTAGGGEVTPTQGNPNDPDWGSDY